MNDALYHPLGELPRFTFDWQTAGATTALSTDLIEREQVALNLKAYFDEIFEKLPTNTRQAYTSDLTAYFTFCARQTPALDPLTPDFAEQEANLKAYMRFQMTTSRKRAVIIRHFTSISKLLRIAKIRDPLKGSEHVRDFIKVTLNSTDDFGQLLKPAVQSQAKALDRALLAHINATFDPITLKDYRDLALVNFLAHTLLRGSELEQIQVENLNRLKETVFVAKTKTDPTGEGCYRFVSPQTFDHIDTWLRVAQFHNGPLFRRVSPRFEKIADYAIGYKGVYDIIGQILIRCGIDPTGFSPHSTRVGAVVDMRRAGMTDSEIMQSGGWKSVVFHRYTAQTEVEFSGAAKLDKLLVNEANQLLKKFDAVGAGQSPGG